MGTEKRERQKAGRAQRLEEARLAEQRARRRRQLITFGVIILLAVVFFGVSAFFSNRSKNDQISTSGTTLPTNSSTTTSVPPLFGDGPCPPPGGSPEPVLSFQSVASKCIDDSKSYTAVLDTTAGSVKVALDTLRTPATANNFIVLSRYGYYNNTKIFRADNSIQVLQGGSPHSNDEKDKGPGYFIADEGGRFSYKPGQIVMARSEAPNSASAQFFFVVGPAAGSLDVKGTYVVFGDVTEGMPVLQQILASSTGAGSLGGEPNPPVTINKVTIEESATPPTSVAGAQATSTTQPVIPGGAATVQPVTPGGAATVQP